MKEERSRSTTFDATAALKAVKSSEGMIAFAGFSLPVDDGPPVEGLLKISEKNRVYRGEELVLTFVIDAEAGPTFSNQLQQRFSSITESTLGALFGNALERFTPFCLGCVDSIEGSFVFELQIVFRFKLDQKKTVVEQDLIPWLEQQLPCRFQPVEWWPQKARSPGTLPPAHMGKFPSLIKKWFGR
jgi:hypothetical protein